MAKRVWIVAAWLAVAGAGVGAAGCTPRVGTTCPTARVPCVCSAVEAQAPVEDVAALVSAVEDMSDPALQGPIAAAADLERRCGRADGEGLPAAADRDAAWRRRCTETAPALPHLLRALEALESRRTVAGSYRAQENTLAVGLTAALVAVSAGNPGSPCGPAVVDALVATLETPEAEQDLRVAARAAAGLGWLGDPRAAAALVRASFVRGERRRLDLEATALLALQRLDDPAAAAAALVRAGRLEPDALGPAGRAADPRDVKEAVALALGRLGVPDDGAVQYLLAELRHTDFDDVDRTPSAGRGAVTPESSRARRRAAAARALGRLGREEALDVILPRLALREDGASVDPTVRIESVPAYLEAIGDLLRPDRTELPLLTWLSRGDPTLRDVVGRRLALQGTDAVVPRLRQAAADLPPCPPSGACIRRNFEERFVPAIEVAATCADVACWTGHLGAGANPVLRERAAAQLLLLARREPASRDAARRALVDALAAGAGEAADTLVVAVDRLSPDGADAAAIAVLERALDQAARRAPEGHEARTLGALLARLVARAGP
jgi:hypothetical protein